MHSGTPGSGIERSVLDQQRRFWGALERKDATDMMEVLAEEFVCRSPGQPEQRRTAFVETLTTIPFSVVAVSPSDVSVDLIGEFAVLTGIQSARVRFQDGRESEDRLALTNVFRRQDGEWRMMLARPVPLSL